MGTRCGGHVLTPDRSGEPPGKLLARHTSRATVRRVPSGDFCHTSAPAPCPRHLAHQVRWRSRLNLSAEALDGVPVGSQYRAAT